MKKSIIWIILIIIILAIISYFFFSHTNNTPNSSNAERISYETEINQNSNTTQNSVSSEEKTTKKEPTETEIAKFSTQILVDDDNRDTNLKITASKINGTIVKNDESFSFNDTVGNPAPDKGYEEASIIVDGKKEKGYGGGNCQVSTTLYDAALKVDGIEITERHEHTRDVGYVEKGLDATVAYDELDLKFKNNTGNDIKIYADVTEKNVNVKIVKLTY